MRRAFERRYPELWERLYPERQLIYRSRGIIRYAALSRPVQIALTFAVLALIGWMGFATTQLLLKDRVIAAKDDRIARMDLEYTSLTDELASAQRRFLTVTKELEAQHRQLVALVQQRDFLEQNLGRDEPRTRIGGRPAQSGQELERPALGARRYARKHL